MVIQKRISYILIIGFVFLIFFLSAISMINSLVFNSGKKNNLKSTSNMLEIKVKDMFLQKKYRFTTSFNPKNKTFFTFPTDYKKSFNFFSDNNKQLSKSAYINIDFIKNNYLKKSNLPVFFDKHSKFLFVPVSYIKYNNSTDDLLNKLDNIFLLNNNSNFELTKIDDLKILNYVFIESENNQILLLISSALDPDPLYPENKRSFIIINKGMKKYNKNFYTKSFTIQNLESINQS